ncbi:hypothetical protein EV121DRAFT_252330 [Schizophyllum commune]
MGRRKIEIQPILHERNRSVTFLKRKNGLFKKAYELGVLCSVDIAVIVFEERPGHHTKLYQYGSRDVSEIVQRHLNFDGDKDSKGPSDFTGANPSAAPNDEEDDEDEDAPDSTNPRKRPRITGPTNIAPSPGRASGARTPSNEVASSRAPGSNTPALESSASTSLPPVPPATNVEYMQPPAYRQQGPPLHLSGSMYPPPQMSNMAPSMSSLPVSSDRHLPAPGFLNQSGGGSSKNVRPPSAYDSSGNIGQRTVTMDHPPTATSSRSDATNTDANAGFIARPGSGASTGSAGADYNARFHRTYSAPMGYGGMPPGLSGAGGRFNYGGPGPGPGRRTPPSSTGGMSGPPGMSNAGGGGDRSMDWPLHGPGGSAAGGGPSGGPPGGGGGGGGAGQPPNASMNWLAFLGSGMNAKQDGSSRS